MDVDLGTRLKMENDNSPRLFSVTCFLPRARLILMVWLVLNKNLKRHVDGSKRQRTGELTKSTEPASLPSNSPTSLS